MKIPFRKNVYIPEEKLTQYILSETHTVGRLKAKFFRRLGFNETNTVLLKESLFNIAASQEVRNVTESPHGKKYIIDGEIKSLSSGRTVKVRTIWILEPRQRKPRFVTAYPV